MRTVKSHPHGKHLMLLAMSALLLPASQSEGITQKPTNAEHVVVAYNPELFHGWPANEGMWIWGDEILVGYNTGAYLKTDKGHNIDPKSTTQLAFSRSTDGGKTWTEESERNAIDFSKPRTPASNTTPVDFSADGTALKMRYGNFHTSKDRGKTWHGAFKLPIADLLLAARTSYIPTGKDSALIFSTALPGPHSIQRERGRSFVAQTRDGGLNFEFLSWIGEDLANGVADADKADYPIHSIMPAALQVGDNHFICALRQRIGKEKWTDVFESVDGGHSWQKISLLEAGSSNPATMVSLPDGRIAAIYGWRGRDYGLRAKISTNKGKSWSDEIILRDDANSWDIGYPQAKVRPDGTVVIVYYYTTTEHPQPHIAATLWKP